MHNSAAYPLMPCKNRMMHIMRPMRLVFDPILFIVGLLASRIRKSPKTLK
jgi:hypothetical protein